MNSRMCSEQWRSFTRVLDESSGGEFGWRRVRTGPGHARATFIAMIFVTSLAAAQSLPESPAAGAAEPAEVNESDTPEPEADPIERYPWQSPSHRPLTAPDRMLMFGLILGPSVGVSSAQELSPTLGAGIYFRYGITDRLEWGIPFFLSYRFGDTHADAGGVEAAVFAGLAGLGFGSFGVAVQPAAGLKLRRLVREDMAFIASLSTLVVLSSLPVPVVAAIRGGMLIDLSDRWALDLSVGSALTSIVDGAGRRRQIFAVGFGGFERPVFRFQFRRQLEFLGTVGVGVTPGAPPRFEAGVGAEIRL